MGDFQDFNVMEVLEKAEYWGEFTSENEDKFNRVSDSEEYQTAFDEVVCGGDTHTIDFYICADEKYAKELLEKGECGEFAFSLSEFYHQMKTYNNVGKMVCKQMLEFIASGKVGNTLKKYVEAYGGNDGLSDKCHYVIAPLFMDVYMNMRFEDIVMVMDEHK